MKKHRPYLDKVLRESEIISYFRLNKSDLTLLIILLSLLVACALSGCAKTVYVPVQSTRTVTEIIRDTTVQVQLQTIRDSVTVADTLSRLENKYAYSSALWSNGLLSHSLGIKPVDIPIEIQYKEIIRTDSIAIPYPVPGADKIVYRQKWWQTALMWLGVLALALFVGWIIKLLRKAKRI